MTEKTKKMLDILNATKPFTDGYWHFGVSIQTALSDEMLDQGYDPQSYIIMNLKKMRADINKKFDEMLEQLKTV